MCFQIKMAPLGFDNLILVSDEVRQSVYDQARLGYGGVDSKSVSHSLYDRSQWTLYSATE